MDAIDNFVAGRTNGWMDGWMDGWMMDR